MKNKITFVIDSRAKDIGITVRRILPWAKKRMVGPFIFLDHMGPATLHPGEGMDVRPHPHIGLSTLTYLFEGAIVHRDSLGVVQTILPGEVNWMTAGKGISHSERESEESRLQERTIHGLQFWVALPKDKEDIEPSFHHYGRDMVPKIESDSYTLDIVAGSVFGKTSPLNAHSAMTFILLKATKEGSFQIHLNDQELALYLVKGNVTVDQEEFHATQMVVFEKGAEISLKHSEDAILAVLGGVPLPEKRFIWWNLVSSDHKKIEEAKRAWKEGSFPMVRGETERIPLPDDEVGIKPIGQPL